MTRPGRKPDGRLRRPGWIERLSLSAGPDVLALLVAQGQVSVRALEAFAGWSESADPARATQVHELERTADDARHALVAALKSSFATPLSQEDIFVLSERCDRVVNRAKNIVAEAAMLQWAPDEHAAQMAEDLREGMASVLAGFQALTDHGDATADAALHATHCVRGVEREYREAMAALRTQADLRAVFTAREMYRFYARAAEALETLADRLWYAVLAEP